METLWLIMMWRSTKAIDLTRDPRILVHSVITSRDGAEGEYKVRGTVHAQTDVAAQRRFADSVEKSLGWRPEPGRFHLFGVDIDEIIFIRYDDASGDQFVACWPKEREFVRRGGDDHSKIISPSCSGAQMRRILTGHSATSQSG